MENAAQQRGNPPLHKHLSTQTSQKTVGSRPEPLPTMTCRAQKHGHKKCQPKFKRQKEQKSELTRAKQFVRNFSSHQLTIPEIKVLAKGLKFIPFPGQPQKQTLIASLKEMGRKMNCRTKFGTTIPPHTLYTPTWGSTRAELTQQLMHTWMKPGSTWKK